jgi:hypothetical protein
MRPRVIGSIYRRTASDCGMRKSAKARAIHFRRPNLRTTLSKTSTRRAPVSSEDVTFTLVALIPLQEVNLVRGAGRANRRQNLRPVTVS